MTKAALLTLNSSDDPTENCAVVSDMIAEAASHGADIVMTPEVTNCVSTSRQHQTAVFRTQTDDPTLATLRDASRKHEVSLLIGSLGLKSDGPDPRFVNRSFLVSDRGDIVATYDKMHMFDVDVSETESYRESSGYAPGNRAVIADSEVGRIGMTVCYDLRFPYLYRHLAKSGAQILTVPSAFSAVTGAAHWEPLLRARAIENGAFVFAPAQTGHHCEAGGSGRRTYGHSLAVSPWGEILFDGGEDVGIGYVEFDLKDVENARRRIPSLSHDRTIGAQT